MNQILGLQKMSAEAAGYLETGSAASDACSAMSIRGCTSTDAIL